MSLVFILIFIGAALVPLAIAIKRSNGTNHMRLLGEELDVTFIVKCSDADFIRTALLPEIMQKFFIVFQQHNAKGTIQLNGDELYYEERGRIGSHAIRARFLALIHALKRGDSSG